jgi:hypothetical protein
MQGKDRQEQGIFGTIKNMKLFRSQNSRRVFRYFPLFECKLECVDQQYADMMTSRLGTCQMMTCRSKGLSLTTNSSIVHHRHDG